MQACRRGRPCSSFRRGNLPAPRAVARGIRIRRGLAPERLELYELNAAFCDRLRQRFPGARVHNLPAQEMVNVGRGDLDAVVSGVPTLPMPDELQAAIVGAALAMMKPGAPFVQITYGALPPLSGAVRTRFGLVHDKSRRIWANLPPAQVYVFRQGRDR